MDAGLIEGFIIGSFAVAAGAIAIFGWPERSPPGYSESYTRWKEAREHWVERAYEQAERRKAAQQQEASNQRSPEAMGGLGDVPCNVVSKEGSLEEREAKLQAQINANPDIQALIDRHRAEAIPAVSKEG